MVAAAAEAVVMLVSSFVILLPLTLRTVSKEKVVWYLREGDGSDGVVKVLSKGEKYEPVHVLSYLFSLRKDIEFKFLSMEKNSC